MSPSNSSEALESGEGEKRQILRDRWVLEFLDAIEVAYFQVDQNGIVLEPTPAESKILGYTLEELQGLKWGDRYGDPEQLRTLVEQVRKAGGRLTRVIQKMIRKDRTFIFIEGDFRLMRDSFGNEIGLEGFYRDVTERIRLQSFLNETTQQVLGEDELFPILKRQAEFSLNYLTAIGHQLQTPLGALVQTLRNFEAGIVNDSKLAERLPYIIGQAIVCIRLVRNLSYMDKILSGEELQKEKISFARLINETTLDFRHLLKEKGIELKIDSESLERHLRVQGHREMLRQVIVNLVDNAIKYSLPASVIHIHGLSSPAGAVFEISNQGLPIPEGERESVFERGFRTKEAKALVPHGTGFGLWLVRKIVEAHDANIRCHEIYEGSQRRTLFRITFPQSNTSSRRHS